MKKAVIIFCCLIFSLVFLLFLRNLPGMLLFGSGYLEQDIKLAKKFIDKNITRKTQRHINRLDDELKDKDPEIRINAIRFLMEVSYPQKVDILTSFLKSDDNENVRLEAVKALGKSGDSAAIDILIEALKNKNPQFSFEAAKALGSLTGWNLIEPRAVQALIAAVREKNSAAAEALGSMSSPQAIKIICEALQDKNPEVRAAAANALNYMAAVAKGNSEMVDPLIEALSDDDPNVRMSAAEALGHLADPRATKALDRATADKNPDVAYRAVFALGKLKSPQDMDSMIAALKHKDPRVRQSAIFSLQNMNDQRAVEPLIAALQDENWYIRMRVASSFMFIKDPRAVEPLIKALHDPYYNVAEVAARTLGELKDPRAIDPLIELLKENNPSLRMKYADALSQITGKNFGDNYDKWKKWRDMTK
ncbi:MAG: HEAT repeat domain-containing protein [Nitrospirae bacterium]|nr:HEAT repeat domain-containing protein [Nitrospirota bacterium]